MRKSHLGVAAKARKRLAEAESMRDVGGLVTDGCLGRHTVRLLVYPEDTQFLAVVCDGQHRRPRSRAGLVRCIVDMIGKREKA